MTDSVTLSLPDDLSAKVRAMAHSTNQTVEEILLQYLEAIGETLPDLPQSELSELEALARLSDDALWTIAREQLPSDVQARADSLMLRKAEAASLLRERGHAFSQSDFKTSDDE